MKVSVLTLGCKVNQAESTVIEGSLLKGGYGIVSLSENPDYCIVNTCSVTSKSDYQSRQLIRKAIRMGAKVIVTGCYAHLRPEEIKKIKGVTCIVDNDNKYNIINMLNSNIERYTYNYSHRSRPYLKIQDGCNLPCSYCVIPLARGRSRSIPLESALKKAEDFQNQGFNEIILTGIHLGSYGKDLKDKVNLSFLLKALINKTKIKRIRLSSMETTEIDDELIEIFQHPRICRHIHIPLQSGDDKVLKLMKRPYNVSKFISKIELIYNKIPDISIGTDIIVGFPGEGSREFSNSKKVIEYLPISYMHIFPFSRRPGTDAYNMPDKVCSSEKKERVAELKRLNISKRRQYMSFQLDKTLDIVVEERHDDLTLVGTSSNYIKVKLNSNHHYAKSLVYAKITGIDGEMLIGNALDTA